MTSYSESLLALEKPALAAGWTDYESGFGLVNGDFESGVVAGTYAGVSEFSDAFRRHFRAGNWRTRSLAAATGSSQASVSKAMTGGSPAVEYLEAWADAFRLKGAERERFIELGKSAKAAAKKDIAPYVEDLETKLRKLEVITDAVIPFLLSLKDKGIELSPEVQQAIRAAREKKKP